MKATTYTTTGWDNEPLYTGPSELQAGIELGSYFAWYGYDQPMIKSKVEHNNITTYTYQHEGTSIEATISYNNQ